MSDNKLLRHYHNLEKRDQKALLWLSIFLAAIVLIYGIIMPAVDYYQKAGENLSNQQNLLNWIQGNAEKMKQLSQHQAPPDYTGQPLMQRASISSAKFGINIDRLQPQGGDKLRVWLTDVPFKKGLEWLTELEAEQGMEIDNISITKTSRSGIVTMQCLLKIENRSLEGIFPISEPHK